MTKFDKWVLKKFKDDKDLKTWLPTKIVYSDEGLRPLVGGYCRNNVFSNYIQIRKKYEGIDNGILKHELTHAKQYGNLFWFHLLFKKFDKYRLFMELDAFRSQIMQYNYTQKGQYMWIVNALTNKEKYGLNISVPEAIEYADFMFEDILEKNKV